MAIVKLAESSPFSSLMVTNSSPLGVDGVNDMIFGLLWNSVSYSFGSSWQPKYIPTMSTTL